MHHARPHQVARVEQGKRAGHLLAVEVAFFRHQAVEKSQLALVNEQAQLAGLAEVELGGQQCQGLQSLVMAARHAGCGNAQQRAAQAIAERLNLALGNNGADGVDGRHDAGFQVVVHAQVAVAGIGVFPRHDEHRVALAHEVGHQRIVRRQIKDVELHDPRRHDQNRLGKHGFGLRAVLDQLDQGVAKHHLAGRDGDFLAWPKILGAGIRRVAGLAQRLAAQVLRALQQVGTAGFQGFGQHLRVGGQKVGRREHVQ